MAFFLGNMGHLFSQGFRNPPDGPSSLSQAGAFIAQCDDASAVTHNPAGLVQIDGQQFLLGSTFLFPFTSYESTAFNSEKKFTPGYLPYFYYSGNMGTENFRVGIGISSPYGQTTKWGLDAARHWNYEVPYQSSMKTVNFTPAIAYRITPEFSAGMGLSVYHSQLELKSIRVYPPPFPPGELSEKIEADGTSFGGTIGLLYRKENYSMGISYKSGFNMKHKGTYEIPSLVISEKAAVDIQFPHIIGAGLALYPDARLKIEFDAQWHGYSSLKSIPLKIAGLGTLEMPKNWNDAYLFSLGAEYKKSEKVKLRAGTAYIKSPVPSSTWEPSIPDADSFVISAGGEFTTAAGIFNMALGANILKTVEREMPYEGKYKSRGYFLSLGYKKEI